MIDNNTNEPKTTKETPYNYPAHWEADVVLRDGATAHLRPVVPTDRDALEKMYAGQSERTIYLRFFAPKPHLSEKELVRFTTVDHQQRVALVLMLGEEMLGIGRFDRIQDQQEAEVAFMISDAHQGRGIGSILLEHLAAAAKELGITRFAAEVLPQNRAMLNVFIDTGYEVSRTFDDGFVIIRFDIDPTDRSMQVMEDREHRAEARSLAGLLSPEVVAVVGDSSGRQTEAVQLLERIHAGGFTGTLVAVGLEGLEMPAGVKMIDSVGEHGDVAEPIDVAMICVADEAVPEAVEACGRAGVRGAIVYSGAFAREGARGRARQKALVRTARSFGMRLIGPESFGVVNNSSHICLNATTNTVEKPSGALGIFSQSAALGEMLSNVAYRRRIGISSLVSAGNRADVSGNDVMQFWEDESQTRVCSLFLESVGNSRKFSRIARRLSRVKPVIVARNAVTGVQLPPGHSVRRSVAPAHALESMLKQAGIISVESSQQMMDVAQLLVAMPLPRGRRVAVVSNAPALAQMVTDRCTSKNVQIKFVESDLSLVETEREVLREVVQASAAASDVDAVLGVFLTDSGQDAQTVADELLAAARLAGKPVQGVFPGIPQKSELMQGLFGAVSESSKRREEDLGEGTESEQQLVDGLPCYHSPNPAVDALALTMDYVQWREKDRGELARPSGVKPADTAELIAQHMPRVQGEELLALKQDQVREILENYGVHLLPSLVIDDVVEAVEAVNRVGGYPVLLKSTDQHLSKRLDLGGVRLGIANEVQLESEFISMRENLARYGVQEIEIQHQAEGGQPVVVEAIEDPLLGPVVSFGMSGDATALLHDWAYRIPPLTESDLDELVSEPQAAVKLTGSESVPGVRLDLLKDVIARVALLKDNHPEIAALELGPVIVSENQLAVARARLSLGNPQQRTDSARRTLGTF